MRKSIAKITALLLVLAAMAAAEETKLDTAAIMKKVYNVRGGINFSSTGSLNSVFGFHAGGMVDIPLALVNIGDDPYLVEVHPGAQFIKKGGKRNYGYIFYSIKYTVDAYYIEAPVPFSIKKTFSDNISARVDFGPYIALGLFGTYKRSGGGLIGTEDLDISVFSEEGLNRFDAGIIYGAVIDFAKRYSVGLHLSSGLNGDSVSSLYMTLGYKL